MEITVNKQTCHLEPNCSVEQMLIKVLKNEVKGIAVAINQSIISRSQWNDHLLKQGDQVMIIRATQGG